MKLVEIKGLFNIDWGAPCPLLLSTDNELRVIFYGADNRSPELRIQSSDRFIIELKFNYSSYHSISPPNDEALNGHPYYDLGLRWCAFYELLGSELIESLGKMSRFHPYYNPYAYKDAHHYIITFKEKVFECVADSFEVIQEQTTYYKTALSAFNEIYNRNG
ncbi:MAG: hypothetical protein JWR02_772 [Mucilaginibacter sp.]|nr:hypothetical protein [Mucilaginibacter sp.]